MNFLPLDPGLAEKMIAGVQDELTDLSEAHLAAVKRKPCPRCQSAMHQFVNPKYPFSPHDPLPRVLGRCTECGLEWDPITNLILDTGDPRKVEDPYIIRREE